MYSPHELFHFLGFFTSWIRIRIQEDFLNADLCGSGSATRIKILRTVAIHYLILQYEQSRVQNSQLYFMFFHFLLELLIRIQAEVPDPCGSGSAPLDLIGKMWTNVESEPKINFGSATLDMLFSVAEPPPPIFFFKKLKYKHFRLLKF